MSALCASFPPPVSSPTMVAFVLSFKIAESVEAADATFPFTITKIFPLKIDSCGSHTFISSCFNLYIPCFIFV